MGDNHWRLLLYQFGYVGSFLFGIRFLRQWLLSEKAKKSHVDKSFWKISLSGNCVMALHYLIQVHFFLCCFQLVNGFLALRNMMLLEKKAPLNPKIRILWLVVIAALCAVAFLAQGYLLLGFVDWVRSPHSSERPIPIPLGLHILGFIGAGIFALRFLLQWWQAENCGYSSLRPLFWYLSLAGSIIMFFYAAMMKDSVTMLSSGLPLAGYLRNIILLKKEKKNES